MDLEVIIPARLLSTRLKNKILIDIHGIPMIEHVRRRVLLSKKVKKVTVATCDYEIKKVVEGFGGNVFLTSENHINGTSRVAEVAKKINCSHILIVQGDEPLILPKHIDLMIESISNFRELNIWNGITYLNSKKDLNNPNLVKCFVNKKSQIGMCFRNNPIFSDFNKLNKSIFKLQGLLAFKKSFLINLVKLKPSSFEISESIEQMRAIENGDLIKAVFLDKPFLSVDNIEQLEDVKNILKQNKLQKEILKKIK